MNNSIDLDPFCDQNDDTDSDFDNICDIYGVNYDDQDAKTVERWLNA